MNLILRRRGLGRTSCKAIANLSQTGIQVVRNDQALPEGHIVFRWGCTSNIETETIVNDAKAIHLVSDKRAFRMILDAEKLCPKTWDDPSYATFPCIVRPRFHHQGRHVYLCKDLAKLKAAWARVGDGYISEFIDKVAEYRVFVVQGRVVCVARKYPNADGGIAWNVYQGGRFENVRWDGWPLKAVKQAITAFTLSGLDFGGVDSMLDKDGSAYVLEINSAPSLTSPYRQKCFAQAFDYVVRNGKAPIPLINKLGGYKKFAHPSVCPEAQ